MAVLVSAVYTHPSVVGLSGSGAVSSLGNIDNGGTRKIRLTKKTNVCKRFGVDPWEQPVPKRLCSGSRLSHVDEPQEIG